MATTTDWKHVDAILRKRSGNRCEDPRCRLREFNGKGPFERHHIVPKSAGGTSEQDVDDPSKLLLLHRDCHTWTHRHGQEARALGLLGSRLGTIRPSPLLVLTGGTMPEDRAENDLADEAEPVPSPPNDCAAAAAAWVLRRTA